MSSEVTPALERKLRAIHDLIESKQLKKALKQCNSSLKKSDNLMLLTMKAFILQKSGEEQESLAIVEEVMNHKPTNPNLIDLITIVYKSLNRYDRLNQIYSDSFLRNPSKETGEILFNSYASNFNFQDQYQIALKLYKTFSELKYGLLAVESMCLIAMHDPSQHKLLDLASMFFTKIKQSKEFVRNPEMIEIELMIERLKGRDQQILMILQGSRDVLADAIEREVEIERKLGNKIRALSLLLALMRQNEATPNLELFLKYVDLVIEISIESGGIDSEELCEGGIEEITEGGKPAILQTYKTLRFLTNLDSASSNFKRTAKLGLFYYFSTLLNKKILTSCSALILPLVEDYIRTYFEIPSVIEDIKNILLSLTHSDHTHLSSSLTDLKVLPDSFPTLCKLLTFYKLQFKLNIPLNPNDLLSSYQLSLQIEPAPKKGEHRLGDTFIMILVKQLPVNHYAAQSLLEYAIDQSPYNYFLKLQLLKNYSNTEFCRKLFELYESLDIKSVQHESLGHLVFGEMNDWRIWRNELSKMCGSSEKFHRYYALDLSESTNQAYLYHHIAQVLDFHKFKNVIDNSLYFHMTQVAAAYLELQKKVQEGNFKMNTQFIHRELSSFTDTIDRNVLNDYLRLGEQNTNSDDYGRWSNVNAFDFERYSLAFVCEFFSDSPLYLTSLSKLKEILVSLESFDQFYQLSYQALHSFASFTSHLKSTTIDLASSSLQLTLEFLSHQHTLLQSFLLISSPETLSYNDFISELKKIVFFSNTFCLLFVFIAQMAKPLIPTQTKPKKGKKPVGAGMQNEFKAVLARFFELIDVCVTRLTNEEFLQVVLQDRRIISEVQELKVQGDKSDEKAEEISKARKLLLKDLAGEMHSIRASASVLTR